jgi:hypothetical protein
MPGAPFLSWCSVRSAVPVHAGDSLPVHGVQKSLFIGTSMGREQFEATLDTGDFTTLTLFAAK